MKRNLLKIVPLIGIFAFCLFYFYPNLFLGKVNYSPNDGIDDLTEMHYPMRYELTQTLKEGRLPLWSSRFFNGFPLYAQSEMGALYPLNLIPSLFLSPHYSLYLNFLIIFFTAGATLYWYLRLIKLSRLSAAFGGITFAFSGFFLAHQAQLNFITAASWLPLCLVLSEKFIKRQKIIYLLVLGIVLGLTELAGGNQITFYMALFILFYLSFFKPVNISWSKLILLYALVGIVAVSIAAVQILPTLELVKYSNRSGGVGNAAASFLNFPLHNTLNFILPYYYYDKNQSLQALMEKGWFFYERYVYVGIVPLLLALITLTAYIKAKKRNKYITFFSISGLLFFILALGDQTFLKVLYSFPAFNLFRVPSRLLLYTQLGIVVLAAFGIKSFEEKLTASLGKRKELIVKAIIISVILVAFVDIFIADSRVHPKYSQKEWFKTPETAQFVKENDPQAKVIWTAMYPNTINLYMQHKELFGKPEAIINLHNVTPNLTNLIYDIFTTTGYSGGMSVEQLLKINDYLIMSGLKKGEDSIIVPDEYVKIARLTNSKYLILNQKAQENQNLELIKQISFTTGQNPFFLYEIKNPLPKAFLVDKVIVESDEEKTFNVLQSPEFKPDEEIVMDSNPFEKFLSSNEKINAKTEIEEYTDEKSKIKINTNKNSLLFMSDTFYPGWNAYIDGRKVSIQKANLIFRAIAVPQGEHVVILKYEPASFVLGALISVITAVLLVICLPVLYWFKHKKGIQNE